LKIRYFADKPEVLLADEGTVRAALVQKILRTTDL
jgi:hypothetical protein